MFATIGAWLAEKAIVGRARAVLGKVPWQVWAALGVVALLALSYCNAEHTGETRGAAKVTAKVEKQHAQMVAEAVIDTGKAQTIATAIGAQTARTNQAATDYVRTKIEDMHHALDVPPAPAGTALPPVDTASVSASLDALVDRANRAAETADQEP